MAFYLIAPREIDSVLRQKHGILIDVREREEYLQDHLRNARNYPYEKIDVWMHYFSKNRALVLYCDYGSTSLLAARKLGKAGYEVYSVVGGIDAVNRTLNRDSIP